MTVRVYIPATVPILARLVEDDELWPVGGTAFAVTPAHREAYTAGDTDELEYSAMAEAARAALRLLTADDGARPRRAVVAADVADVTLRPDLEPAVVRLHAAVPLREVAAVHLDTAEAEGAVRAAVRAVDEADLGDEGADLALGDAEDHELAWYAPQELPFVLELM
jgi:hypothetical protein